MQRGKGSLLFRVRTYCPADRVKSRCVLEADPGCESAQWWVGNFWEDAPGIRQVISSKIRSEGLQWGTLRVSEGPDMDQQDEYGI